MKQGIAVNIALDKGPKSKVAHSSVHEEFCSIKSSYSRGLLCYEVPKHLTQAPNGRN